MDFSNPAARAVGGIKGIRVLCIGAHQDDVEMMAMDAILRCKLERSFGAVIVTDGAGSPRTGEYAGMTDGEMVEERVREQLLAAELGNYGLCALLMHKSSGVKSGNPEIVRELAEIIEETAPEVIYMHNLCDRHDTHVAVALRTIEAIRSIPQSKRPKRLLGIELWRNLDWIVNQSKVLLPVDDPEGLAPKLVGVFRSQISGGKRYDLAYLGRLQANATFYDSHTVDTSGYAAYAVDMSCLLRDDSLTSEEFVLGLIGEFREDVVKRLNINGKDC